MITKPRRGMLLLIVLALLAMFAMIAVAFVVMTGANKRSADQGHTIEAVLDPPAKTLDQAFNVVVRGVTITPAMTASPSTPPPTSAIKWQSLLEKIYGYETIGSVNEPATMTNPTAMINARVGQPGQLIEFTLPTNPPDRTTLNVSGGTIDPYHYVGCVVTMLSGSAAGLSSRIVGIDPRTSNVQMLAFEGGAQAGPNDQYIVNGFPYSGMGFGFSNSGGGLSALALTPNAPPATWGSPQIPQRTAIVPGGVNGDYTAADYQDPLVALAVPSYMMSGSYANTGIRVPIPSLHRADLLLYMSNGGTSNLDANNIYPSNPTTIAMRQVMFRPIGQNCGVRNPDHPNFTGSNPNFNPFWDGLPYDSNGNPVSYAWDVDNDGDGVPDSVWVDLGMPVRFTKDGHAYKPLFAILCLDMDGRLNINAHSSIAQAQQGYYPNSMAAGNQRPNLQNYTNLLTQNYPNSANLDQGAGSLGLPAYFAGPATSPLSPTSQIAITRGQGTGPAEVSLLPLLRDLYNAGNYFWGNYQALLSGGGGIMGRYGSPVGDSVPGIDPLQSPSGSLLTMNNAFPFNGVIGGNYWSHFQTNFDAHGSPPDHQTFGAVALDPAGRPVYISMGGPVANGPYDIDLSHDAPHASGGTTTADSPFSVGEVERILRAYDRDAVTLPQRLAFLTNNGSGSILESRRAEFTSESWNVPCASAVLPPTLRMTSSGGTLLANKRSVHPVDIIEAKIRASGGTLSNLTALNAMRLQLLPWEVLEGLKMDLNRPFGTGAFSLNPTYTGQLIFPGSGAPTIPDQPGTKGERVPQYANSAGTALAQFNYAADGGTVSVNQWGMMTGGTDSLAARQLYARHLYVLAMALSDSGAIAANLRNDGQSATAADVAHLLAQWAVNVVAYRDHNGIMIPFVYDPNPFSGNGWGPANPNSASTYNTPQYTVWGCKRPELLISEALAFHDVRTQDLSNEVLDKTKLRAYGITTYSRSAAGPTTAPPQSGLKDPGFNSAYRPQGSLFVELFNPWTIREPRTTDLGPNPPTQAGANGWPNGGVQLTKMTPTVNRNSSPVWRMIIVDPSKLSPAIIQALAQNGDELPDPDNPTVGLRPAIERVVYFVPMSGNPTGEGQVMYYPAAPQTNAYNPSTVVVPPGGYAVIGSGDANVANRTYVGFPSTGPPASGAQPPNPSAARWVTMNYTDLAANNAGVVRGVGSAQTGAFPPPQVLGIDQAFPAGNGPNATQRLSISEPVGGYVQYEKQANGGGSNNGAQVTYNSATGQYSPTLDIPVDQQRTLVSGETFGAIPIWTILNTNGTTPSFRIIYLQRLADPTRPWSSDTPIPGQPNTPQQWNPYRTIDAMTVDLTCFNGASSTIDQTAGKGTYYFESRQRGEKNYLPGNPPAPLSSVGEVNVWKQEPALKSIPIPAAGLGWSAVGWTGTAVPYTTPYMSIPLTHSLGYLNKPFGTPSQTNTGDPQYPFPWLNWSYRPFNNVYELLLVPTVSSSRLLARGPSTSRHYYNYVDTRMRAQPLDVYGGSTSAQVPYPHLLNFFESKMSSGPLQGNTTSSTQLHRLFAYVGVPSRFANVQLQMPANLAGAVNANQEHFFHTPFNRVSRYREPGLINLNTVTSPDVLLGAMNMYVSPLVSAQSAPQNSPLYPQFWDKFVRSRAGDAVMQSQTLDNMLRINPQEPSRFMRPFRTPGGAFLTAANEPTRENDVSFFRGDPDTPTRPLFELDDALMKSQPNPLQPPNTAVTPDQFTISGGNAACIDYNRNPYFRYQLMQKLGSVTSTHSNVFAIWITVGYFEVTPAQNPGQTDRNGNLVYPDGYQLGQELGSDTGDIVRHRAFYIFDRSIPVGFVRGQDINQDKATLLKRYIE